MAVLGYNTIGGTDGGIFTDASFVGCKFTATEDGDITKIWGYIEATFAGGSVDFQVGIYSDNAGSPDVLLAESTVAGACPNTFGWASCDITYSFSNADVLWLCFWVNDAWKIKYDAGTTDQGFEKYSQTYSTWANPADDTTDFNYYSTEISIYAEYTPVATASTKQLGLLGVG
jgi:hypothetical protein